MVSSIFLEGNQICLRSLTVDDVTETYCEWMNDPEINQYLESRFAKHTVSSLRDWVREKSADENYVFLAIVMKNDKRHVGNIKLGPIDWNHRLGDIGLIVGERDCWGKGVATEAISLISKYAFEHLKLHKLTAGCYGPNEGSARAFEKAGFQREGFRKRHFLYQGKYVDLIQLAAFSKAA